MLTADPAARRVVAAVHGDKLKAIPQRDAKRAWRMKESAPALRCRAMAVFFASKRGRPSPLRLARMGMLQRPAGGFSRGRSNHYNAWWTSFYRWKVKPWTST